MADLEGGAPPFDVVGLGALNVDVIADATAAIDLPIANGEAGVGDGELAVDHDQLQEILAAVTPLGPKVFHGGSSFNTVWTAAMLRAGLRLGFVGVQGTTVTTGLRRSHVEELQSLGVATLVDPAREAAGVCVSLADASGRRLFTNPGSNLGLGRILDHRGRRRRLLYRLAGTGIVHVTSLVEAPAGSAAESDPIAASIGRFLRDLQAISPATLISLDPGAMWTERADHPAVAALFAVADVVFVNDEEFAALESGRGSGLRDRAAKARYLIHKQSTGVEIWNRASNTSITVAQTAIVEAIDPTGAGDAFAAGFLVGLSDDTSLELSAKLGLELAARRVSAWGDEGFRR